MAFLSLPAEIRLKIYEYAIGDRDVDVTREWVERRSAWRWKHQSTWRSQSAAEFEPVRRLRDSAFPLLLCCKQTYDEGLRVFFETNRLHFFNSIAEPADYINALTLDQRHSVRYISFYWEDDFSYRPKRLAPRVTYENFWEALGQLPNLRYLAVSIVHISLLIWSWQTATIYWPLPIVEMAQKLRHIRLFMLLLPMGMDMSLSEKRDYEKKIGCMIGFMPPQKLVRSLVMGGLYPDSDDDIGNSFE